MVDGLDCVRCSLEVSTSMSDGSSQIAGLQQLLSSFRRRLEDVDEDDEEPADCPTNTLLRTCCLLSSGREARAACTR